jgi:hypothetical protein
MREFNHHDNCRDQDTRGHTMNSESETRSDETDDTEGHRFVPPEERPSVGDTPEAKDDDGDDTEGHRYLARNVGASFDDDPADAGQDTDRDASADASPGGEDPQEPDDTEGHRLYNRNVGAEFDDTEGHHRNSR